MQEGKLAGEGHFDSAPFALSADLELPCDVNVDCALTLSEAADADKREAKVSTSFDLAIATRRSHAGCHSQSFSFLTQVKLQIRKSSNRGIAAPKH